MSYCRFGWEGSDVYVFESAQGIQCCGCKFGKEFTTSEPEQMILHLALHRRAGHFVPDSAILSLWDDIPGAFRPSKPEPTALTHASLLTTIAMMKHEADKLKEKLDESAQH